MAEQAHRRLVALEHVVDERADGVEDVALLREGAEDCIKVVGLALLPVGRAADERNLALPRVGRHDGERILGLLLGVHGAEAHGHLHGGGAVVHRGTNGRSKGIF